MESIKQIALMNMEKQKHNQKNCTSITRTKIKRKSHIPTSTSIHTPTHPPTHTQHAFGHTSTNPTQTPHPPITHENKLNLISVTKLLLC